MNTEFTFFIKKCKHYSKYCSKCISKYKRSQIMSHIWYIYFYIMCELNIRSLPLATLNNALEDTSLLCCVFSRQDVLTQHSGEVLFLLWARRVDDPLQIFEVLSNGDCPCTTKLTPTRRDG